MTPVQFEKDNDDNFHMAFITACSNLRAASYKIPPADFQRTKFIAGKIIPAMISTTAVVSGLQCLELIKTMQGKPLEAYKNGFVNIALPLVTFSEPIAAAKHTIRPGWNWTLWDHIDVQGDITVQEFINLFANKFQLEVSMLSCGSAMLFSFFLGGEKRAQRLVTKLSQVVADVLKCTLPADRKFLIFELCCSRKEDGEDVDVPPVRYILH
jgi:ubiquitin-activating enzyme E1